MKGFDPILVESVKSAWAPLVLHSEQGFILQLQPKTLFVHLSKN